ncbi:hypothetical protein [Sphingomonas desiccabilis]|uniref:Uncharacterized protein n=1 Tax=Sphingomonas desiccabilis TaxID=429134 RepID=A0A4Q2IVR0_9SPHN|nr:hypothetical protein [Sphingomonas desiccabilis]MBB3910124.1 hypothetical protein [Sphingomonas desiccabilis]RXZ34809.1 hypothetical protein EO081_03890 [Sphingomonas desiccabilis]
MKFFRALNIFATVRDLRAANASLSANLSDARSSNYLLRVQRDCAIDAGHATAVMADTALEALEIADRVVDAHMDEREELKARIVILESEARVQASETLEVVSYVKSVEAALKAVGISITDAPSGPQVVAEEAAFLAAVRGSRSILNGQRLLQAA